MKITFFFLSLYRVLFLLSSLLILWAFFFFNLELDLFNQEFTVGKDFEFQCMLGHSM